MSHSGTLVRGLKVMRDKRPLSTKKHTPDRRVLWKRDRGPFEVWMHATKGLRAERRHADA